MSNVQEGAVAPWNENAQTIELQINDIFRQVNDVEVSNFIENATYNRASQEIIFSLLRFARNFMQQQPLTEISHLERVKKFSEIFKFSYPELQAKFEQWKNRRSHLIEILTLSSHNVRRNFIIVSGFRILTGFGDILSTLFQTDNYTGWPNCFMEYAPYISIVAYFIEKVLTQKIHDSVQEAIKEDEDYFENLEQYFKQTKELDRAIRNFFPYGIDKDIVRKIQACTDINNDFKIFLSVVVSNAREDVKLLKDVEFLEKAVCFASSNVGKIWLQKEKAEDDPYLTYDTNVHLHGGIQDLYSKIISLDENMKKTKKDLEESKENTVNEAAISEISKLIWNEKRKKITLNFITIMLIFMKKYPKEVNLFKKLSESAKEDLQKVETIVHSLNPSESNEGSISQNNISSNNNNINSTQNNRTTAQ